MITLSPSILLVVVVYCEEHDVGVVDEHSYCKLVVDLHEHQEKMYDLVPSFVAAKQEEVYKMKVVVVVLQVVVVLFYKQVLVIVVEEEDA